MQVGVFLPDASSEVVADGEHVFATVDQAVVRIALVRAMRVHRTYWFLHSLTLLAAIARTIGMIVSPSPAPAWTGPM